METLAALPQAGPVRALPPAVAAGERATERAAAPPHFEPTANGVNVEWARRSDGVQVMTYIDRRTGVVISQTPAEQVLAVVDAIVAAIVEREG
jgi:uncharacterized iron-regulated membrane protein